MHRPAGSLPTEHCARRQHVPTAVTEPLPISRRRDSVAGPDLPLSQVAFSCRLPVIDSKTGDWGTTLQGGFITFPEAVYSADPAGLIQSSNSGQPDMTSAAPALHGIGVHAFYDAAMKRWVPVAPNQASPDGKRYAYVVAGAAGSEPTYVHIVHVVDGSETLVPVISEEGAVEWQIGDFDGSIVYLIGVDRYGRDRVWHFDPGTGINVRYIDEDLAVFAFEHGHAWIGVNRYSEMPPALYDGIARFDAYPNYTGGDWFYRKDQEVNFLGLDANDHPIVSIGPLPSFDFWQGDIRLITYPGDAGVEISNWIYVAHPQGDVNGRVWFSNSRGIYLFTRAGGLRKVFAFTGDAVHNETLTPAGYCR